MRQLILRACELNDTVDLWHGYEPVWNSEGEIKGYKWLSFNNDGQNNDLI